MPRGYVSNQPQRLQYYTGCLPIRQFDFSKRWRQTGAKTTATLPTFDAWLPQVSPHLIWDWPHLVHTQRHLEAVTSGEVTRLMVFEPPRHGNLVDMLHIMTIYTRLIEGKENTWIPQY